MSERRVAAGLFSAGIVAAGCASEASPMIVPELEAMQVACVNVKGVTPYTNEGCAEVAVNVEAGLRQLSEQTGGKIKPIRVSHKLYPDVIEVDNAIERRCTNFNTEPRNIEPIETLVTEIANVAVEKLVDVDFNNSAAFIAVNAPNTLCSNDSKNSAPSQNISVPTEECPKGAKSRLPRYGGAVAVFDYGKPIILGFTDDNDLNMRQFAKHELLHFGRGQVRLDHEFAFCNKEGVALPNAINMQSAATIGLDGTSKRTSVMGEQGQGEYVAPPHLLHMGVIEKGRVYKPTRSGELTIREVGTNTQGVELLQLPLKSEAIKTVIGKKLSKGGLKQEDYTTFIGKIPGQSKVGVYAAPQIEKVTNKHAPIFLIDDLDAGQKITIQGDFELTVKSIDSAGAIMQLQMQ